MMPTMMAIAPIIRPLIAGKLKAGINSPPYQRENSEDDKKNPDDQTQAQPIKEDKYPGDDG